MQFSLVDILSIIALLLGCLYNFQILTLKNRTKAINYFSFYLSNITFIVLFFFLLRMNLSSILKYFTPLLIFSVLIMPISMWIYLKKVTQFGESKSLKKHYIFPVIASGIIVIDLLLVLAIDDKTITLFLSSFLISFVLFMLTIGFLILNSIYLFLAFKLLNDHQKRIKNHYSYTQEVDLEWVKTMLFAYVFLIIGLIVSNISSLDWTDYVFYIVLIIFIVFTGHNALKQKNIWNEESSQTKSPNLDEETVELIQENYSESQLEMFQMLKEKLVKFMEEEKPYIDQDLSILKLAKDLGTNTKYLSYVINKEFNQSFINYVNAYRIQDVKSKLKEGNLTYTIEALSQNAGFKSKSSFNAAFKKYTGKTPSQYLTLSQ